MNTRKGSPNGNWRRNLFTLALLVLATALADFALARGPRRAPPDPAEQAERMAEDLDLSEAQQQQVQAIFEDRSTEEEQIREEYGADREAARDEMESLRDETDALLLEVLTDEQAETFQESRDRRPPPPPPRSGRRD